MRVTPDLVSVWYFSPFDSNSMTWGRAGNAHSMRTTPHAPASRCMTLYYDSARIRCAFALRDEPPRRGAAASLRLRLVYRFNKTFPFRFGCRYTESWQVNLDGPN